LSREREEEGFVEDEDSGVREKGRRGVADDVDEAAAEKHNDNRGDGEGAVPSTDSASGAEGEGPCEVVEDEDDGWRADVNGMSRAGRASSGRRNFSITKSNFHGTMVRIRATRASCVK